MPPAVYGELHLLPSILSADFCRLAAEVDRVMDAGVRLIHVDVMDGHFVPNITLGPPVIKCLAKHVHARGGFCSVHLMIENPEAYLADLRGRGRRCSQRARRGLQQPLPCRARHQEAGSRRGSLALNPGSDIGLVREVLPFVDFALVMTVNPGFGGQEMIESALAKVPRLRELLPRGRCDRGRRGCEARQRRPRGRGRRQLDRGRFGRVRMPRPRSRSPRHAVGHGSVAVHVVDSPGTVGCT